MRVPVEIRRHKRSALLLATAVGALFAAAGCGAFADTRGPAADAEGVCDPAKRLASEMASIDGLLRVRTTTARELRSWIREPSMAATAVAKLHDDAPVSVCAYSGTGFVTSRPPGAPHPDTVVIFVLAESEAVLHCVGPQASIDRWWFKANRTPRAI